MGVDLTLLPFEVNEEVEKTVCFSHSVLGVDRDRELFKKITELEEKKGIAVPFNFYSYLSSDGKYEEPHYGITTETPYGTPLNYLRVKDLLEFKAAIYSFDKRTKAVWAYLKQLPPKTKIALYWH